MSRYEIVSCRELYEHLALSRLSLQNGTTHHSPRRIPHLMKFNGRRGSKSADICMAGINKDSNMTEISCSGFQIVTYTVPKGRWLVLP